LDVTIMENCVAATGGGLVGKEAKYILIIHAKND
jgi:hypothetical protein